MDEERSNLGRFASTNWRHLSQSSTAHLINQRLLADLIGGDRDAAEQLAATLLSAFGSVGSILAAPSSALARFIDDDSLVNRLTAAKALVMESLGEQLRQARFDISNRLVQLWIIAMFKGRRTEHVHFALLGNKMQLLWEEDVSDGNLHNVDFSLRKIVSRGVDLGAAAVVLLHNHPSNDPQPSQADIDETRRIATFLKQLDLRLEDHLIVSDSKIFSMQRAKLI